MFVRHPLYRLYSAYNDKLVGLQYYYSSFIGQGVHTHVRKNQNGTGCSPCYEDITFEEFVKFVIYNIKSRDFTDVHWAQAADMCKVCSRKYDIIGKIETFSSDLELLQDLLTRKGVTSRLDEDNGKAFLLDKCHHLSELHVNHLINSSCKDKNIILKAKLKSSWNRGFTEEFGFTYDNFYDIPKEEWMAKCMELVKLIMKDPQKKKRVKDVSLYNSNQALQGLSKKTFDEIVSQYETDFRVFDYDPNIVFTSK